MVASQVVLVVKDPPVNVGDASSIPGSGGSPGEGVATHSAILVWKTPWTEEPSMLQSLGLQRVRHDQAIEHTQGRIEMPFSLVLIKPYLS